MSTTALVRIGLLELEEKDIIYFLAIQIVIFGPAALLLPRSLFKMQNLRPSPDLLNQTLLPSD